MSRQDREEISKLQRKIESLVSDVEYQKAQIGERVKDAARYNAKIMRYLRVGVAEELVKLAGPAAPVFLTPTLFNLLQQPGDPSYSGPIRPGGWTLLGRYIEFVEDDSTGEIDFPEIVR